MAIHELHVKVSVVHARRILLSLHVRSVLSLIPYDHIVMSAGNGSYNSYIPFTA